MSRTRNHRAAGLLLGLMLTAVPALAADGSLDMLSVDALEARLEAERGNAVVVNLWATWCVPCLREIPDLMALEQEFANDGLVLIAIAMDDPYDRERVDAFRAQHFPGFRSYLRQTVDMDELVSVIDPAWNELMPTTYLIGRDGAVVRRIQGKLDRAAFRREFAALLQ